ncbi:unnamed protein product [Staurois parvus]|uniref:Uncharacterized protein n=1 Tax=Staurois parvus TaxID=386267 RepID=A0ABN9GK23_9NEOB|nr:unnamed protein product [Staurois parvus]
MRLFFIFAAAPEHTAPQVTGNRVSVVGKPRIASHMRLF